MKQILLIFFGLVVVAGFLALRFRTVKRLNPKTELLIAALKCINGREDEGSPPFLREQHV